MDEAMLGDSTLNFDNRTLIRYNFDDIVKNLEEMRYINDNKSLLLNDIDSDD